MIRHLSLAFFLIIACLLATGAAFGASHEALFDGGNASVWDPARDQTRLLSEFTEDSLTQASAPASLRWRFVSKGVAFNDIFLRKAIDDPYESIRVRARNDGAPVTLALKVRDASGAEWTANQAHLEANSGWRWVTFPKAEWHPAPWSGDPDGKLDFPLSYLAVIAFDVRTGVSYDLRISRIEAVRPDPPTATVRGFAFASSLQHGGTYPLSARFALDRPCLRNAAWLAFKRDGIEKFRIPVTLPVDLTKATPGRFYDVKTAPIHVSEYADGGRYDAALVLGNSRIVGKGAIPVSVRARKPGQTVAAVKPYRGVPTLFINGKPHNEMTYMAYGPSVKVFSDFAKAGVDLFSFSATPTESAYGLAKTAWTGPGRYDFSEMDQRIAMVLQANPKAYFFPRLYLHAPKWWSEKHPNDLVLFDPGDGKPIPFIHEGIKPAPSWASETWRKDTVEALRRLIAHIESSPYADRCIGYHIASGTTEEWMMWGSNENQWVDYSPVNQARFREWLKSRYETVDQLREAWSDPSVDFETASIPPKTERETSQFGSLRDLAKERRVIDYYEYNSDLDAGTIAYFAKAIKEITHRKKIVGSFYGYLLQLCGEQRQQNGGHLALEKLLASPDIDFLCSPSSYLFRQVGGEGTSHIMSLLGSVRLHGKLWFDENDIRTSISPGEPLEAGKPADIAGDILQLDKELANVQTNGAAQWWFDVGANRYDDPAIMKRIAGLVKSDAKAMSLDRSPMDEVAMVVDERSLTYLRTGDMIGAWSLDLQIPAFQRIGAPVGYYLATDLPKIANRKLFLFVTSYAPTDAERKAIDALKGDGRVLVFLYAPGIYRNGEIDESAMSDLTGIRLKMSREPETLQAKLVDGSPLVEGMEGRTIGVDSKTLPICYADDPDAKTLGVLPDGRPGLVVKDHGTWTSVFSAVPMLPSDLLRRFANLTGVHSYLDGEDVVWASKNLLSVSVFHAGKRTIRLREPSTVSDLFTGEKIGSGLKTFDADFKERATRAFVVMPKK